MKSEKRWNIKKERKSQISKKKKEKKKKKVFRTQSMSVPGNVSVRKYQHLVNGRVR